VGFIGFRLQQEGGSDQVVRLYLECQEESVQRSSAGEQGLGAAKVVSYTYAVDVLFASGQPPCSLRGVNGILVLKKFYKLVNSLEERAREHGNDRSKVFASPRNLAEHLNYTRNARDFTGLPEPKPLFASRETE
jgi:hypothetical protein